MILRIEDIKNMCSKLLTALDVNKAFTISEVLELKIKDELLYLSITNREYFVTVKIPVYTNETFHATVKAETFLKLMNQITTDTIELLINDNSLVIKGDGNYNLPLIFEGESLMALPKITIENETNSFVISSDILKKIYQYNSRELNKDGIVNPVQTMYYLDDKGCITFTTGACVTDFSLDHKINVLLSQKIVKLFKLFKSEQVNFRLGKDENEGLIQTKVEFYDNEISIIALLVSDENLVNSVPANNIRGLAYKDYDISIVINKDSLSHAISRMSLFVDDTALKPICSFETTTEGNLIIRDKNNINSESIKIENVSNSSYKFALDLVDLKSVIDTCKDEFITMNFGNHQSVVVQRPGIYNVIPECII